jgi:hypothetical protein
VGLAVRSGVAEGSAAMLGVAVGVDFTAVDPPELHAVKSVRLSALPIANANAGRDALLWVNCPLEGDTFTKLSWTCRQSSVRGPRAWRGRGEWIEAGGAALHATVMSLGLFRYQIGTRQL